MIGYLAPEGFTEKLIGELRNVKQVYDRLVLAEGPLQKSCWVQNIWYSPTVIPITSIGDGVRKLRDLQRNWALYPFSQHRRARLIEEQLPHVSRKKILFPSSVPLAPLGSWTLLDADTILASTSCSSPYPNGEFHFEECKIGPPSRAYLKLWEALTRVQQFPKPGERCLEVGASPGSWTWVLSQLGANVVAVDRAELDPAITANPLVQFIKGDAFKILPASGERFDWIFSDLICYPEKLYEWISAWMDSGQCSKFVCTIKLQGNEQEAAIARFAEVPGSQLLHLFHNKHELTWIKL
jgi:23S rRNA (cytidine2498-2'-O)-methyltransferase